MLNQRPELFRAALLDVPFVDVLNTMSDASLPLTVGEYEEWGNPTMPEQYRDIRSVLPVHEHRRAALPRDPGQDLVQRQPGDVLGAGQVRGQAARAQDRREPAAPSTSTWTPATAARRAATTRCANAPSTWRSY